MFDIGFPELLIVSIVALLVIGPERLPETIRTIMLWLGRIRSTFTNIKNELEQEIGADEIRRQLHNETILKEINESKNQISDVLKEADQSVQEFKGSINQSIDQTDSAPNQDQSLSVTDEPILPADKNHTAPTPQANQNTDNKPAT